MCYYSSNHFGDIDFYQLMQMTTLLVFISKLYQNADLGHVNSDVPLKIPFVRVSLTAFVALKTRFITIIMLI